MSAKVFDLGIFRRTGDRFQSIVKNTPNQFDDRPTFTDPLEHFDHMIKCIEARVGSGKSCMYETPVSGMKLDSYGRGCSHNSVFQWHPKNFVSTNWNRPFPFPSDLRKVFKAIEKNKGRVMVLGYRSDPFMWMDHKFEITKAILEHATKHDVQLAINTMSDLCSHDDYIELIKAGNHSVTMNMSLNDGNDDLERMLSPGAPSLKRRRLAIDKLKENGVEVSIKEFKELEIDKRLSRVLGLDVGYILKSGVDAKREMAIKDGQL